MRSYCTVNIEQENLHRNKTEYLERQTENKCDIIDRFFKASFFPLFLCKNRLFESFGEHRSVSESLEIIFIIYYRTCRNISGNIGDAFEIIKRKCPLFKCPSEKTADSSDHRERCTHELSIRS